MVTMKSDEKRISSSVIVTALRIIADQDTETRVGIRTTCSIAADRIVELENRIKTMTEKNNQLEADVIITGGDVKK